MACKPHAPSSACPLPAPPALSPSVALAPPVHPPSVVYHDISTGTLYQHSQQHITLLLKRVAHGAVGVEVRSAA